MLKVQLFTAGCDSKALLFFQLTKFGPQWPMNVVSSDLLVNWDVAFISLAC